MSTFERRFGQAVRRAREEQGLSQERLGEIAKLDRTYVSGLERATRNPTLATLHRIAKALGVPLSELIAEAERRV